MTAVPAWYPGPETKPAPMPLLLVQAFLNTRELDEGTDLFSGLDTARSWLAGAGLLVADGKLGAAELELVRDVREAIRNLVEVGVAVDGRDLGEADLEAARRLADNHQAKLRVCAGGVLALENARDEDVEDRLFGLLLIIRQAQEDGTWWRLKVCANPDCRWAFYDRSRNQQGNWCDMAVCGNRIKNRQLRARRR
jgi:predicted RNA-binding Zn ribbon-like protein